MEKVSAKLSKESLEKRRKENSDIRICCCSCIYTERETDKTERNIHHCNNCIIYEDRPFWTRNKKEFPLPKDILEEKKIQFLKRITHYFKKDFFQIASEWNENYENEIVFRIESLSETEVLKIARLIKEFDCEVSIYDDLISGYGEHKSSIHIRFILNK